MSDLAALLDSPANQQFLPDWYHDGAVIESGLRKRLYAEYAMMGNYPRQPMLYAVASGRGDGKSSLEPRSPMIEWSGSAFANAQLYTLPASGCEEVVAQGEWLTDSGASPDRFATASTVSWEGVAGSLDFYNDLINFAAASLGVGHVKTLTSTACVVPTISALDIDQDPHLPIPAPDSGASPFDDYICASGNLPHIATDENIRDWILGKLTAHLEAE